MKKRILFVDDEPRVLEGLKDLLTFHRSKWEMEFACSGQCALEEFEKSHFDVIVADLRMPGMDGIALLESVRAKHPQTVRIVLSGQPQSEVGLRALPVCHQFLSKPCDPGVLINAVNRTCGLQELVGDESVRKVVGGISRLPALPSVYAELQVIVADERTSAPDVARVVRKDIAISAKVLQIVNSAFFGLGRNVTSIEQAIVFLGVPMVQQIVLAASVFSGAGLPPGRGVELNQMRDHALFSAAIVKNIFRGDRNRASEGWTAGLLHDVGKLVLASGLPGHLPAALDLARRNGWPLFEAEKELYGVTHAEIGAYLLGTWGLPYPIIEAVANHHCLARVQPKGLDLVVAVHVADAIAHESAVVPETGYAVLDIPLLESLGLLESLEKWRLAASELSSAGH